MPTIQDYLHSRVITRDFPNAVTFDLSSPARNVITIPAGSAWSSALHWHETHVEFLKVVQGSILLHLDGEERVIEAPLTHTSDGKVKEVVIRIEKGARHCWGRADGGNDPNGGEVVVIENTDPADGGKAVFFWTINAVMVDGDEKVKSLSAWGKQVEGLKMLLRLMVICNRCDCFPVAVQLPSSVRKASGNLERLFERLVTGLILFLTMLFASGMGMKAVRKDQLPADIWTKWNEHSHGIAHSKTQ